MNFTITWSMVKQRQGQLWLRVDDVDAIRARPEFVQDIHETLRWLGFSWERELPAQSARTEFYWTWLQQLPHYACDCSRKSLVERGSLGHYDGYCRTRGLKFATGRNQLRLRSATPERDVVLWRKENLPAYHLASVVDDLESGVTLIVRGEDLRESTSFQQEIATLLGDAGARFRQIEFIHHPLLAGPDGAKLSKSKGDLSLKAMRETGDSPADVFQRLQRHMGLPGEFKSVADFQKVKWQEMDWALRPSP